MNTLIDPKPIADSAPVRLSSLTDDELLARIPTLMARERAATAALVAHLAELEARRLYLSQGCPSMFAYCVEVLHLSECQAYARIEGARVAQRFPIVIEMLRRGDVHLSAIGLLARCLTQENHLALLTAARHKTKREVERQVADVRPRPTVPDAIRKLPGVDAAHKTVRAPLDASAAPRADEAEFSFPATTDEAAAPSGQSPFAQPSRTERTPARRAGVEPLGGERWKVQFTASAEVLEKLRLAQDLLRHQLPCGDLDRIFDRALSALVQELSQSKFAANSPRRAQHGASGTAPNGRDPVDASPAASPAASAVAPAVAPTVAPTVAPRVPPKRTRHIPADVRRQVSRRDGRTCAFVGAGDRRCGARGFLEFHHVTPYARGGDASVENIQLRCRAHNQYESDLVFATGSRPSRRRGRPLI